jgi:hypothetical protein
VGGSSGFLGFSGLLDHAHDVALLHDEEILAVDAHLGARPLAEEHAITSLHVEGNELAALVAGAGANGDDFALLGLLLGGIGDDDAALRLFFVLDAADDDAVMQRTECHGGASLFLELGALTCAEGD